MKQWPLPSRRPEVEEDEEHPEDTAGHPEEGHREDIGEEEALADGDFAPQHALR